MYTITSRQSVADGTFTKLSRADTYYSAIESARAISADTHWTVYVFYGDRAPYLVAKVEYHDGRYFTSTTVESFVGAYATDAYHKSAQM